MDSVQKYLADWIQITLDKVTSQYKQYKRRSSGNFINKAEAVNKNPVKVNGTRYTVTLKLPMEWKYVNYGVKGIMGGRSTKGYSFKGDKIDKDGYLRIRKWMRDHQVIPNASNPTLQRMYKKRKEKTLKKLAYAISTSVMRKGIKPEPFFDDVVTDKYMSDFRKGIATSLKDIIIIALKR